MFDLPIVSAENGYLNEIPTRCFQKLSLSAEIVNSAFALVAVSTELNDKHMVLGDPLSVDVDDVVDARLGFAAHLAKERQRIPITTDRSVHSPSPVLGVSDDRPSSSSGAARTKTAERGTSTIYQPSALNMELGLFRSIFRSSTNTVSPREGSKPEGARRAAA
jgi:hypothetical protein